MNLDAAIKLSFTLFRRTLDGAIFRVRIDQGRPEAYTVRGADGKVAWGTRPSARFVFSGGDTEHSIDVYASDEARVLAHWAGYLPSGVAVPAVGGRVDVEGRHTRRCIAIKVGPKRVTVEFHYKGNGKVATKTLPFADTRFGWSQSR